eukprot:1145694-Pelagomonas_calceolata.AAC.2
MVAQDLPRHSSLHGCAHTRCMLHCARVPTSAAVPTAVHTTRSGRRLSLDAGHLWLGGVLSPSFADTSKQASNEGDCLEKTLPMCAWQ